MNLIMLFTDNGPVYVDTTQLANRSRTILTMYTARGNRLKDVGSTKAIRDAAAYGVHRENLYATQDLADAASAKIFAELFGAPAAPAKQSRKDQEAAQAVLES